MDVELIPTAARDLGARLGRSVLAERSCEMNVKTTIKAGDGAGLDPHGGG
jgi:hypothetical protein